MSKDNDMQHLRGWVESALETYLSMAGEAAPQLGEAMRYSALDGGKRLRPILCLAACDAAGGQPERAMPAACAVEMIHCYSLIHDDLPAMDDDDLRRGRPATHRAFGEAMAILAGDALLTMAFEILSRDTRGLPPDTVLELVTTIARGAGPAGMVAGQVLDLQAEGNQAHLAYLEDMHRRKTGALIWAAVRSGGLVSGCGPDVLGALESYAAELGLLYQITDDLLDLEGEEAVIGKPTGSDQANDKLTYPSLLGVERSREMIQNSAARARRALEIIPSPGLLVHILDLVVARDR